MYCPFCRHQETSVINTRLTRQGSQMWRRRKCTRCNQIFTTYERPQIHFVYVKKRSGQKERYSHAKLFAGIYSATLSIANKENIVDELTSEVESQLLDLKQKEISSTTIAEIVLTVLKQKNVASFTRYLAYHAHLETTAQLRKELRRFKII